MKKTLLLGIALAVILVPGVMAQASRGLDSTSAPSMKNTATGGLWGNDMDNAQDVNDYQDVEFDKFFAFLTGTSTGISGGFAKNFSSIYVGIYYTGSLVSGNSSEGTNAAGDRDDTGTTDVGFAFTDNLYGLIGTPVGGFKLGILSDFRSNEDKTTATKITMKAGRLGLGLIWGKNFDVGPGTLKPEIGILYGFNPAETKTTTFATDLTTTTNGGYAPLQLLIQGDYVFPENGGRQSVISFSELFDYHIFQDPTAKRSPALGLGPDTSSSTTRKGKEWDNTLSLGFKRTYELDEKFSVAWNAEGVFSYSTSDTEAETEVKTPGSTTTTHAYGDTTTTIGLTPRARLGFTYQFVPDKFDLHGHAGVQLSFTRTKVSSNVPNSKESTTTTNWDNGLTPFAGLGGTFQLHPMAAFDFAINTTTGGDGLFGATPAIQASVIIKN
ncbi:MAG: hypothetical protein LBK74_00040 [Treponema sp.]|jgi:hypothetical protein|nr:hypothetical protein [Treponema sp.]